MKETRQGRKARRKKEEKLTFLTAFCEKILKKISSTHRNSEKQTPFTSIATILQYTTCHTCRKEGTHLIFNNNFF